MTDVSQKKIQNRVKLPADHVDEPCRPCDVSADVAERLAHGARDDVHLGGEAVALADAGPLVAVQAHRVNLVHEGEGAVPEGRFEKLE